MKPPLHRVHRGHIPRLAWKRLKRKRDEARDAADPRWREVSIGLWWLLGFLRWCARPAMRRGGSK